MELTEKTIKEELIYKGRVFNVYNNTVTLPDGREAPREFIEHNGGVCVLPVLDNGDVILVKQFRYGIRNTLIEIPAGKLEKGENHKECGLRELKEEIGATPKEFIYLGECLPTTAYPGNSSSHVLCLSQTVPFQCDHPRFSPHSQTYSSVIFAACSTLSNRHFKCEP